MPYVNHRWLGGLLTNWRTISERIARLHELRRLRDEGQLELLPSKERISMMAELEKLEVNLGGVADMKSVPDAVFVVDLRKEQLAVREARRLGAACDRARRHELRPRRCRLRHPGNDDAIRSCSLIVRVIANAIDAGKTKVTAEEMAAAAASTSEAQPEPGPEAAPAAEEARTGAGAAAVAVAEAPEAEAETPAESEEESQ